ncbi:hypothetical protein V2J09_015161 [Rumex salicifolius]
MFQTLAVPSPVQSLSFAAKASTNSTSLHFSRRAYSVRCSAATVDDFSRCLVESRHATPASLYEVLKVKQNASPADIKKAYRRLAKIHHPDAASDSSPDGRDFIQIYNAYETLSDPMTRSVYDLSIGRMMARSAGSTSSFNSYSSSSSSTSTVGRRPGFYPTRRWESDQCW